MPKSNMEFFTYKCFLCKGYGRIAIVNPKKLNKISESELCPICDGKGFMRVKKSD